MSQLFISLLNYAADNLTEGQWRELTPNVRPALLSNATQAQEQYAFDYLVEVLKAE